jgi:transposase
MLHVTRIGIDLAKQVFQVHGVDERGHTVLRRRLARSQVRAVLTQLPPCVVGLEVCGSAHYGARELRALGHDVRLMAPQSIGRTTRMMGTTRRRSAKPWAARRCASSR